MQFAFEQSHCNDNSKKRILPKMKSFTVMNKSTGQKEDAEEFYLNAWCDVVTTQLYFF